MTNNQSCCRTVSAAFGITPSLSSLSADEHAKKLPRPLRRSGAQAERMASFHHQRNFGTNCNQAIAIIRPNGSVFRPFLRHWLDSREAQTQMRGATVTVTISNLSLTQIGNLLLDSREAQTQMRGATVTGTISNLSLTQIGNLRIPLPSLEEQRRIAAKSLPENSLINTL